MVLAELECQIAAAVAWTHNSHSACVIYVEDEAKPGCHITDPDRVARIEERLENVVEAHHVGGKQLSLSLTAPAARHTERRLHQLMLAGKDYEQCGCGCEGISPLLECAGPHVSIEGWKDKGYSVVNIRSRDRPKLLFDTVCTLTDMDYVVSHAVVSSDGNMANQVSRAKTQIYFVILRCFHVLSVWNSSELSDLVRATSDPSSRDVMAGVFHKEK